MGRRFEENPQTYSLRLSAEALLEIRNIYHHIAFKEHQPVNAEKVYFEIRGAIGQIAQNPFAFKECEQIPTVSKIYRRSNCLSWAIIYKISGAEIIVLGVAHHASRISRIRAFRKRK